MNRRINVILVILSVFLLLAACSNDKEEKVEENNEREPLAFAEDEFVDNESPVLIVNGEEVNGLKYNQRYRLMKTMLYEFGEDVSGDTVDLIKKEVMDRLVVQEVINQDASKKGINVTENEVEQEIKKMRDQDKEQFEAMLDDFEMEEEDFKKILTDDLMLAKYIQAEIDEQITDEDIEAYYNELKEENEDIANFKEVKDQIFYTIQTEKFQERVEELKEKAEIEELI